MNGWDHILGVSAWDSGPEQPRREPPRAHPLAAPTPRPPHEILSREARRLTAFAGRALRSGSLRAAEEYLTSALLLARATRAEQERTQAKEASRGS